MQFNMHVEGTHSGGSEQASSSDDGQFLVALIRKMMRKEMEVLVIRTVQQIIVPTIGELVRNIVKEEIQSVEKRLLTGGARNFANEMTVPKERTLLLKFLDEVSVPVLTGKLIQGKGGNPINVALVDETTGQIVNCGPESSAKVEILVLDSSGDDNESNLTRENFKNKIIRECDKTKPHFAKSINIYLKEGIGALSNAKLGHDSNWMKSCKCRLGARIVESFRGIEVQEAWTESFIVSDCRGELYKNHYPPSLSDDIWRLENIGRDGAPCKRLNKKKICKVRDFLFLHSVDPQRLEQIASDGNKIWKSTKWKATVDHAQTCIVDDTNIYMYYPSTESKMGVIFDAVGGLKGVICESHYVPTENISADEKVSARQLLLSAFENRKYVTSFNDEASLLQKYPYRSTDVNVFTNPSIEEGSNGNDLTTSEYIDEYFPSEPDTSASSQSIIPCVRTSDHSNNIHRFGSLEPTDIMNELLRFPVWPFPDLEYINEYAHLDPGISSQSMSPSIRTFDLPNNCSHFYSLGSPTMGELSEPHSGVQILSCQHSYPDLILESSSDDWSLTSLDNSKINNTFETLGAESQFHRQNNARALRLIRLVVNAMLFGVRTKKKVMALGGIHVPKRPRI